LRRVQIGSFTEKEAISLDTDAATAQAHLLPTWRALQDHLPIIVSDGEAASLLQGKRIAAPAGQYPDAKDVIVMDGAGRVLAVTSRVQGGLQPHKVLVLE
jgi:tRNA U55 pseudouridine synthase TruB